MRATASFGVLVLCAGPWVSGCDSPFEPASYVADLTMLAASADAPTAHPGETVTVRTLIVNPAAEPIQWAYFTCVDPAEQGFLGCAHAPNGPAVVGTGSEVTPSLQIPTDTISRLPEPARASSLVGLGIVLCPGTLVLDWTNLDEVTGPARCLDSSQHAIPSGSFVTAFKRISVRTTDRNQNPVIDQLLFDDEAWPSDVVPEVEACAATGHTIDKCADSARHSIVVKTNPESFERGVDEFGVSFEERVVTQFYGTDGLFEFDLRTADVGNTRWAARPTAKGTTVTLWFVVRDDRGGATWESRQVKVR